MTWGDGDVVYLDVGGTEGGEIVIRSIAERA